MWLGGSDKPHDDEAELDSALAGVSPRPVAVVKADWVKSITSGPNALAPSTVRGYKTDAAELEGLKLVSQPTRTWSQVTMEEITERDVGAYYRHVLKSNPSASTLNKRRAMLRGIFEHARSDQWGVRGLCSLAGFPFTMPPDPEDFDAYDEADVFAIMRALTSLQDRVIVLIAAFCGLRLAEILGLHWKDVDWSEEQRRVMVRWQLDEATGEPPPPEGQEGPAGAAARLRRRPAQRPLARARTADR